MAVLARVLCRCTYLLASQSASNKRCHGRERRLGGGMQHRVGHNLELVPREGWMGRGVCPEKAYARLIARSRVSQWAGIPSAACLCHIAATEAITARLRALPPRRRSVQRKCCNPPLFNARPESRQSLGLCSRRNCFVGKNLLTPKEELHLPYSPNSAKIRNTCLTKSARSRPLPVSSTPRTRA